MLMYFRKHKYLYMRYTLLYMRIRLAEDSRDYFFNSIKENLRITWKELRNKEKITRSSFDNYKSGKLLIPDKVFERLCSYLTESQKEKIMREKEGVDENFGQIIGGKRAYAINFEKFKEGREKGLRKLKTLKREHFQEDKIKIKEICLDKNICELIGAFIGDGFFNCYKNKLYHIEFSGDSRYDIPYYNERIIPIIRSIVHNIQPHIYKVKGRNCIRVVFYSKNLYSFFKERVGFNPGRKTYDISITNEILNSEFINSTIRGIFDTDGGVFLDKRKRYKKPYPRIIFQTVSKPLYTQLFDLLSKDFKLYTRFNNKRNIYVIEIYGHKQLKKWMSKIGFSNKRHLDKIASVA